MARGTTLLTLALWGSVWGADAATYKKEVWGSTGSVTLLKQAADFPGNPDSVSVSDKDSIQEGIPHYTCFKLSGWVRPQTTGKYVLYIAADDTSELKLSTDASTSNAVKIAGTTKWTDPDEWDKYPAEQTADPVDFVAGVDYYIEVLACNGNGPGHVSIGWRKEEENEIVRIADVSDSLACPKVEKNGANQECIPVAGRELIEGPLTLKMIPRAWLNGWVYYPYVYAGDTFKLTCTSSQGCDFFLSVYHCPPCGMNGDYPAILKPSDGFDAASCAPKAAAMIREVNQRGAKPLEGGIPIDFYRMTTFHVRVPPGESKDVPPAGGMPHFMAIFATDTPVPDNWCAGQRLSAEARCGGPCPPSPRCVCPTYYGGAM